MAIRQFFRVNEINIVETGEIDFQFYSGFALSQKQKSIESFHEKIGEINSSKILEISSKSTNPLGVALSAFNLKVYFQDKLTTVENIFQASKVFQNGGPYTDLLFVSAIAAKKDERIRNSGNFIGFCLDGKTYPTYPCTLFYDFIYCLALSRNPELANELVEYDIFTDIEFNHKKSINCQAHSAAIFVALSRRGALNDALKNVEKFQQVAYNFVAKKNLLDF